MVSLEHLWSLSILDPQGQLIERVVTNEKGIQKSMENKDLWILHPKSARLIPWEGKGALLDLKLIQGGYEAKVDAQGAQKPIALEAEKKAQAIEGLDTFDRLAKVIKERNQKRPEGSYTTHLFEKGIGKILKKTGEEAVEILLAKEDPELIYECADFIFHLFVLFEAKGLSYQSVLEELERRMD